MPAPRRRGRRPGKQDTRDVILEAARAAFADGGFDGTSIRQIAADAGVDPALVHHYFGTKDGLFVAVVRFPLDPDELVGRLTTGPIDDLGHRIADTFLTTWEDPVRGPALAALLRGGMTNRVAAKLIREFFTVQIIKRVAQSLSGVVDADELPTRAGLVASQLFGLAVVRHILELEPLVSTPRSEVVEAVAPTIQRYLVGSVRP